MNRKLSRPWLLLLIGGLALSGTSVAHDDQASASVMSHQAHLNPAPATSKQPYDLQFLDTMAHHHQGAINMAKMALTQTSSAGIKTFAQDIITKQEQEIAQFKTWREAWYSGKSDATNMKMPGMSHTTNLMQKNMPALQVAQGMAFDRLFLELMIPHHQSAIDMSKPALKKLQHPELKESARKIIDDQAKEITQMKQWLQQMPK